MVENHPWMKIFTWASIIGGISIVFLSFSEGRPDLIFVSYGILSFLIGAWAFGGTRSYQYLSQSSPVSKGMAFLSVLNGALLSGVVIIFVYFAYAALKQEATKRG